MRPATRVRGIVLGGVLLSAPIVFSARPCAQWVCSASSAPDNFTGSLTNADPTQTGRLVRDGYHSVCTRKANSVVDAVARHYKIAASVAAGVNHLCLTVNVDTTGCGGNDFFVAAYDKFTPANPALDLIGDLGDSPFPNGSFSFPLNAGQNALIVVSEVEPNTGCPAYAFNVTSRACAPPGFERTTDRRADATVFRPSDGVWYTIDSTGAPFSAAQFGASTDVLTPGTYTNSISSAATNLSVWRPGAAATWFFRQPGGGLVAQPFGTTGDIPVPSDFDADGKIDYTVFRPSTGVWWSRLSTTSGVIGRPWGQNGDIPFAGDVDGDRVTDYGIVRPVAGSWEWWILRSRTQTVMAMTFGFSSDKLVAADYDGDRRTDIAVWRPSNGFWYYIRSSDNVFTGFPFGLNGDIPQPADRDGDGKTDFVVFRQSLTPGQTIWYSWLSATGTLKSEPWGLIADVPALAQNRLQ